jgi:hypothetical protein
VVAFDGDRDRTLASGESAIATVTRDGPFVINVERCMRAAALSGVLTHAIGTSGIAPGTTGA